MARVGYYMEIERERKEATPKSMQGPLILPRFLSLLTVIFIFVFAHFILGFSWICSLTPITP